MQNKPEYTRFLPHYHPVGGTFFITFRLHGSLPGNFLEKLKIWATAEKSRITSIPDGMEQERAWTIFHRDYFRKYDQALDQCLCGPVFLKEPGLARLVLQQIDRFDQTLYRLLAFTIMANHVHLLLDFSIQQKTEGQENITDYKNLDYVMHRIKGASARYINLALGHTGQDCWQTEYHDRYIRDRRHLLAAVDYIKQNPVSAKICSHWKEHAFTYINECFW